MGRWIYLLGTSVKAVRKPAKNEKTRETTALAGTWAFLIGELFHTPRKRFFRGRNPLKSGVFTAFRTEHLFWLAVCFCHSLVGCLKGDGVRLTIQIKHFSLRVLSLFGLTLLSTPLFLPSRIGLSLLFLFPWSCPKRGPVFPLFCFGVLWFQHGSRLQLNVNLVVVKLTHRLTRSQKDQDKRTANDRR